MSTVDGYSRLVAYKEHENEVIFIDDEGKGAFTIPKDHKRTQTLIEMLPFKWI